MIIALHRRQFMLGAAAVASLGACASTEIRSKTMYGLIGKFTSTDGDRDRLSAILLKGLRDMPGCLSYIVANDPADANALWITEVWDNADSHKNSLTLPSVQAAIQEGRPLIAGMEQIAQTAPIGGHGLTTA
ncbi:putative quinol monooxygenase [Hyphomonas oceanitis]|uniref:Antibiotic biosynthesis monooxygenase domain-containing protein n=1 Tax=Hyphomonas oceanitis SCH89 TaxID=1280953 RepID=A0A059G9Y4_9PROT|nr:putative quinol monooxygenase [Hyphomonas oceanitis]KDA03631.1 antibiotic biosynthesis monooxygenase domain-containing protein [Hyphomonas oceanitis SCH89]